jgi:hypothetical protein
MRLHFRKRRRFLHGVLLTLTLFSLAFFVYAFSRFAAFRVFGVDLSSHEVIILFASVVVAVLFYKPLDALILILFKEVLFRSSSRDFSMLTRLARSLRSILNQAEIANVIVNTFGETWGLRYASVLVRDKTKGDYRVVSAFRIKPSQWKHTVFKQE